MSLEKECLREKPVKASGPARSKKRRAAASRKGPLDNAIEAFLVAEASLNEAIQVFDGPQWKELWERQADEEKLREMEGKIKEARRAAATANLQWQQTSQDLRKGICSVASWRMWEPIFGNYPEDVAQEVFMKFFKSGPRDDARHARNWIFTTTKNRTIDLLRGEGARGGGKNPPPSDDEEDKDVSGTDGLEETTLEQERIAVELPLPPDDRDIPGPDNVEEEVLDRMELGICRGKLHKALEAAHNAIKKTHTRIENPDEIGRVFEEMVRYGLTPREIVARARPSSPYAVIDESREEWKRATNLVSKHKERYQTALKEVSECLCPEHQAILSSLFFYVKS